MACHLMNLYVAWAAVRQQQPWIYVDPNDVTKFPGERRSGEMEEAIGRRSVEQSDILITTCQSICTRQKRLDDDGPVTAPISKVCTLLLLTRVVSSTLASDRNSLRPRNILTPNYTSKQLVVMHNKAGDLLV